MKVFVGKPREIGCTVEPIHKAVEDLIIVKFGQRIEIAIVNCLGIQVSKSPTYRRPQIPHVSLILHREHFSTANQPKAKKRKTRKIQEKPHFSTPYLQNDI
jgi:hypothetical protein